MVYGKYTRLPSKEPEFSEIQFDALDGPSYFSYGVQQGKYKSVFTYSSLGEPSRDVAEEGESSFGCRICYKAVTIMCYVIFVISLPISLVFTLKIVKDFERFVIFRLGRYQQTANPGHVIVLPCIDSWKKVDMRMKAFSVPPQKVITTDNAVIEMGAEIFYNVVDPLKSVNNIQDLNHSTRIISQISLQKHVGRRNLSEIESARQSIIDTLKEDVNEATKLWGVEVTKIELSSLKLYSRPNQANNPLSLLGPVLFPPGSSNPPLEQLQRYFSQAGREAASANCKPAPRHHPPTDRHDAHCCTASLMESIEELIDKVSPQINHNLVKEFGLLYRFVVTSDVTSDGKNGIFYLDLKNGEGKIGSGYPFSMEPDVTLTLTNTVLQELMLEKLSPFNAYMGGQLSISGDLKGAMRLGNLIENLKRK